jgi:hypothetical protein
MKKDFIPYGQALELKELGFDEPCFGYRDGGGYIMISKTPHSVISAPTFSQAFRFFREKHNLYGFVTSATHPDRDLRFSFHIGNTWDVYDIYDTPEEAELGCIKKLIELVRSRVEKA